MNIDPERLSRFRELPLKYGKHSSCDDGMCAIEAYHWLRAEPHTDTYASLVIGTFMRTWNDSLISDEEREILKPLVLALVEVGDSIDVSFEVEQQRGLMAANWYFRQCAPTWLEVGGYSNHAKTIRDFPVITAWDDVVQIEPALRAAWNATKSAAWGASWSAAWSAAWGATANAAESAARSAMRRAMRSAAESAAWGAARNAAEGAMRNTARRAACSEAWSEAANPSESSTWNAPRSALTPTVAVLQASATDLVRQMIAVRGSSDRVGM